MDISKVTSKGQITIPVSVRRSMGIKTGDKIVFFEENGRMYIENSTKLAFQKIAEALQGEAEKAGFATEEELQAYAREVRKEVRGY